MGDASKTNPSRARKGVEVETTSLKWARDGSAFTKCEACNKDVPVGLIDMHSCSLDSRIKMNLEAQIVEKVTEVKKRTERKKAASSEPKAKNSKKEKKVKDPNMPKRAPTAFFLFMCRNIFEEQKFLIGVILMVPCYAVESFVSLMNPSISVDCEILRDCYEAFAMYCFGRYLVACLGGEKKTIIIQHHQIPKPQFMQGLMVGSMTGSCRFYDASGLPAGSDVSLQFKQSPNCGAFHVNAACKDLWKHFCSCPVGILPGESVKLLVARVQI